MNRNSVLETMHSGPSFHFTLDLVTLYTCCHTFSGPSVHCHPGNIAFHHVGESICWAPCLFYGLYPSLWGALRLVDSRKLCRGAVSSATPSHTSHWHLLGSADCLHCPHGAQTALWTCAWNTALK